MLVVGTSAIVQPAASLPAMAKNRGAYLIEINLEKTPLSAYADEVILGAAAEELPKLWPMIEESLC
jgi:NAD-dependent deacetylase